MNATYNPSHSAGMGGKVHLLVKNGSQIRSACSRRMPSLAVPAEQFAVEQAPCVKCAAVFARMAK